MIYNISPGYRRHIIPSDYPLPFVQVILRHRKDPNRNGQWGKGTVNPIQTGLKQLVGGGGSLSGVDPIQLPEIRSTV